MAKESLVSRAVSLFEGAELVAEVQRPLRIACGEVNVCTCCLSVTERAAVVVEGEEVEESRGESRKGGRSQRREEEAQEEQDGREQHGPTSSTTTHTRHVGRQAS